MRAAIHRALAVKAPATHVHPISDTTGLQDALDAKSATGHNHTGVYEAANANIQAHVTASHAPANAQKNSDITKAEIEAVLTGEIASHTHAGGSAAWGDITGTLSGQTDLQTALDAKQATLVSATNIKTVNGASLLGSGDLAVSASDTSYIPGSFTVATETWKLLGCHLKLTTDQRATLAGTGRLSLRN